MEMFGSTCGGTHPSSMRDGAAGVSPAVCSRTGSLFREPGTLLLRLKHTQMTTFGPFAKMQEEVTWSSGACLCLPSEQWSKNTWCPPREAAAVSTEPCPGHGFPRSGQELPPGRVYRVTRDRPRSEPPSPCQHPTAAARVCGRGQPSDAWGVSGVSSPDGSPAPEPPPGSLPPLPWGPTCPTWASPRVLAARGDGRLRSPVCPRGRAAASVRAPAHPHLPRWLGACTALRLLALSCAVGDTWVTALCGKYVTRLFI